MNRRPAAADAPHLPRQAPIEAYGKGGFRFAGLSHRGSLLCLPDGIWAWPVASVLAMTEESLLPALARAGDMDFFLLGAGRDPWVLPEPLRRLFRDRHLSVDVMPTGAAIRIFNIVLGEGRRVGAALIAVE